MPTFNRSPLMTARAKSLRNDATRAEKLLWAKLARAQTGVKFRRQHALGRYILDFYCTEIRLAIELDGGQHALGPGLTRDKIRDSWLESRGVTVLRFWNEEVFKALDMVFDRIVEEIRNVEERGKETPP